MFHRRDRQNQCPTEGDRKEEDHGRRRRRGGKQGGGYPGREEEEEEGQRQEGEGQEEGQRQEEGQEEEGKEGGRRGRQRGGGRGRGGRGRGRRQRGGRVGGGGDLQVWQDHPLQDPAQDQRLGHGGDAPNAKEEGEEAQGDKDQGADRSGQDWRRGGGADLAGAIHHDGRLRRGHAYHDGAGEKYASDIWTIAVVVAKAVVTVGPFISVLSFCSLCSRAASLEEVSRHWVRPLY